MPDPAASQHSFGFGRRLAALLGVVIALFAMLGVVVSYQLGSIHTSVRRVLEEQREHDLSRDLVHELRTLRRHLELHSGAQWAAGSPERAALLNHVAESTSLLDLLSQGPGGEDPSEDEHASDESRMYATLKADLEALGSAAAAATGTPPPPTSVDSALHVADVLNREMYGEERKATNDLYRTARNMRSAVLWVTGGALAVLLVVLWLVKRSVILPVERLRRGAARLAGRDLSHRVDVRSNDELGELAREFNRMAAELEGMHTDLERRVEERTSEFLRAARLAGLGTMAAGIAHEINNPLASIATCAEGLERKLKLGPVAPEQEREYLQIIAKEAYRAHGITSRLLEFARREPRASVPFSLPELLREIDVLLEHRLRARELALDVRCESGLPPMRGDPSECKQVLLNLIHNAIDASPPREKVRVECRRVADEIVLEVEDHGAGIPPESMERLFDPFFTTKGPGEGTGLGLAIVHRIVESHHGRIEAENTGHGALFRVRIPLPAAEVA